MNTVFIQNIITPYRNRFFNMLSNYMNDFSVYYMAETEPSRSWDVKSFDKSYDFWIDKGGKYIQLNKRYGFHFNPGLVIKVLFQNDIKNIVLAVSYHDPNILAIILAKRLHITKKRIFFWAEANYLNTFTEGHEKLKAKLRRFVFSTVDGGVIIPGKMSEITFDKWNIPIKQFIKVPNTINDLELVYENLDTFRQANKLPIFVIPVRIIERIKGVLNFFQAIGDDNVKKSIFMIAGDGEDLAMYKEYVELHGLAEHVVFCGFCNSVQMSDIYNKANVLLLPSFTDSSPLTLVEGLKFHLPILCSNHCGNHYEVVNENVNGYTFSPLNRNEIKEKYEKLLNSRCQWQAMGEASALRYKEIFDTGGVVERFVEKYKKLKKQ